MTVRFIPSPTLLWLNAALAVLLLAMLLLGIRIDEVGLTALGLYGLTWLAAVMDALLTRRQWHVADAVLTRTLPAALALGAKRRIDIHVTVQGEHDWQVELFDHCDATLQTQDLPVTLTLQSGTQASFNYQVIPTQRGEIHFDAAALRIRTRWRLLDMVTRVGERETRRVYPDFAQLARYAWLAGDRRLAEIGIKTFRQRGEGTDFKQLAEYHSGDPVRHIDWKASLRFDKLIVRQFQNERDQAVVFVLDCGRRLRADDRNADVGASHFDQVLNAVMLLSYVALKQGDAVGAMTFGTPPGSERWFAPRKGALALNALMSEFYAVQPSATHSDYLLAARDLLKRLAKRALVVMITNFREEDSDELSQALALMRSRHLVMAASLRETVLAQLIAQPIVTSQSAVDIAGAHHYAQHRQAAFNKLAARNTLVVDAEPEQLGVELVNRYQAVKRAGMI
jgi:uncharacterized protein (DUF58 family)